MNDGFLAVNVKLGGLATQVQLLKVAKQRFVLLVVDDSFQALVLQFQDDDVTVISVPIHEEQAHESGQPPRVKMSRELRTVYDVWREYTEGLGG